ncbi:MAG: CvpA family protein [Pseudobdellovibrionaceae bacterium]
MELPENLNISGITDLFIIGVVLISAAVSFFRGLIKEVLTIAGVIGGALAALMFGQSLVPTMENALGVQEGTESEKLFGLIPYEYVAVALAYGAIFLSVIILLSVLSHFLTKAAASVGLGPVDRTLGVLFGIARAILLLGILYLPLHIMLGDKTKEEWFKDSSLITYVQATSEWMSSFLPDNPDVASDKVHENIKDIKVLNELFPDMEDKIVKDAPSIDAPSETEAAPLPAPYEKDAREKLESLIEEVDQMSEEVDTQDKNQ